MRVLLPCPVCGRPIDLAYQLGLPLMGFERNEEGDLIRTDRSPWCMLTILCETWPDCRGAYTIKLQVAVLQTALETWPEGHPMAGRALQLAVPQLPGPPEVQGVGR